ncbi:MAG: response regulator [Helicobacteraceae bacterium]|jgi:chemotaxis protein histidine kinase CheA|nr:response regulator [Helicobacteraceae bacterium]
MALNKEKYVAKFVAESRENITAAENGLMIVVSDPAAADELDRVLRYLHTLKGSARMLNLKRVESLAHKIESAFVSVRERRAKLSERATQLILLGIDALKDMLNALAEGAEESAEPSEIERELINFAEGAEFKVPKSEKEGKKTFDHAKSQSKKTSNNEKHSEKAEKTEKSAEKKPSRDQGYNQSRAEKKESKARSYVRKETDSVRVDVAKIDEIIKSLSTIQNRENEAQNLGKRLNQIAAEFDLLYEKLKLAAVDERLLDDLVLFGRNIRKSAFESRCHSLNLAANLKTSYDGAIALRMLPLSTILDAYPRVVYDIATQLGKRVRLTIEGAENEIDKNTIEAMQDALLHIIRNTVDHGIESPAEREAAGKEPEGKIQVSCRREGGNMKISIKDDGRGIDYEGIRRKVVALELKTEEDAANLSEAELINFIFQSGFSTSSEVSQISGRGVGLDAARIGVERVKGAITTKSEIGRGSEFIVVAPLSIAALMGFGAHTDRHNFVIPANFVENIFILTPEKIVTIADCPYIEYQNKMIRLHYLHNVLKIRRDKAANAVNFAVITRVYDDLFAIAIDDVKALSEHIVKPMPKIMERLALFNGAVVSEDYGFALVLNIPSLVKMARRAKSIDLKAKRVDQNSLLKRVLVADDSASTREIVKDILEGEGYAVDTANDGAQALAKIKERRYDLVCTDINMPNMDGFELTRNIRKSPALRDLAVIMISVKSSKEDMERARLIGVDRYIIKHSFQNRNLIRAARELIGDSSENYKL